MAKVSQTSAPGEKGTRSGIDWPVLALSFLGALLFLGWRSMAEEGEVELTVRVAYEKPRLGFVYEEGLPTKVKLRIRGPKWSLMALLRRDIPPIVVDAQSAESGIVYVDRDRLRFIKRPLRVVEVEPPYIVIRTERIVERTVPVRVDVMNASDARLRGHYWSPSRVKIKGPRSLVYSIPFIYAGSVRVRPGRKNYFLPLPSLPEGVGYTTGSRGVVVRVRWEGPAAEGVKRGAVQGRTMAPEIVPGGTKSGVSNGTPPVRSGTPVAAQKGKGQAHPAARTSDSTTSQGR